MKFQVGDIVEYTNRIGWVFIALILSVDTINDDVEVYNVHYLKSPEDVRAISNKLTYCSNKLTYCEAWTRITPPKSRFSDPGHPVVYKLLARTD